MKYSNGTYKNAGQNLIFKTELSQNEIIRKLETHDAKDTLDYDFYEKNGEWFIYDIDLVGVSIIQTYRQQFAGLLKEKSFDEMFKQFKNQ